MPTYSEMLPLLGVKAKSAAEYWTKKLLEKGALEKDVKGFLKPARLSLNLPLVGNVAAGFPSPAEEELRDTISFDEYLVNNRASSFVLSVTGDSMIGRHILDGDFVVLEHGLEPRTGGGTVWLRARRDDGHVAVTVADDGDGFTGKTSGTGIGLKNVRERLRLRYGGEANLSVVANFPAGVAATLTLPAAANTRTGSHG